MRVKTIFEEVTVQGYGRLTLDQAKKSAATRIQKALSAVTQNPEDPQAWKNAQSVLYGDGVLQALMKAVISNSEQEV